MTQHAAAKAAGITQGRVWQYLDEVRRTTEPSNASATECVNARSFAATAGIDEFAFRRWLRETGVRAGHGHEHQLPQPSTREGKRVLARYKAETGR